MNDIFLYAVKKAILLPLTNVGLFKMCGVIWLKSVQVSVCVEDPDQKKTNITFPFTSATMKSHM